MRSLRAAANVIGVGSAIVVSLLIGLMAYSPNVRSVVAMFPPWWSTAQVFRAAGGAGTIVGVGRFGSSVIVRDDRTSLAERLRAAGALFTFDAGTFGGCRAVTVEAKT